jgi:hypothetical protein
MLAVPVVGGRPRAHTGATDTATCVNMCDCQHEKQEMVALTSPVVGSHMKMKQGVLKRGSRGQRVSESEQSGGEVGQGV